MTASAGRIGISEGAAVVIASVVLTAGLAGLMAWRVRTAESPPDEVTEAVDPGPRIEALEAALATAEATTEALRAEVVGLKAQVGAAEAERLDARAAADAAGQAQWARVRELEAERDALQARLAETARLKEEMEIQVATAVPAAAGAAVAPPPAALPATSVDGHSVSARVLHNVRVVDANENLEYVVLDAGKQDGVREGMVFHVMDGDQVVARLRAADVRDDLTGATVESVTSDRYPRPSDRVILRQHSDK